MRNATTCLVLSSLLLLLGGCHDDVISDPATALTPSPLPTYAAERTTPESGQVVVTGKGTAMNGVRLYVHQNVVTDPAGLDLHLRVDPAAHATLSAVVFDTPCGAFPISVGTTGNPGEWRLHRVATYSGCTCPLTAGPLLTVDLHVGESGSWPVSMAGGRYSTYETGTRDLRNCDGAWGSVQEFFGGTITNPPD